MTASLENERNYISYSRPGDEYGKLGNMAGGMPLVINGHDVYASEHVYLCGYWSLNTETQANPVVLLLSKERRLCQKMHQEQIQKRNAPGFS